MWNIFFHIKVIWGVTISKCYIHVAEFVPTISKLHFSWTREIKNTVLYHYITISFRQLAHKGYGKSCPRELVWWDFCGFKAWTACHICRSRAIHNTSLCRIAMHCIYIIVRHNKLETYYVICVCWAVRYTIFRLEFFGYVCIYIYIYILKCVYNYDWCVHTRGFQANQMFAS